MANLMAPKGLRPIRHLSGSPWNGAVQAYLVPSTDGTALFVGDVVKGSGSAAAAGVVVNGIDCEGMNQCIRDTSGTTGQETLGVVVGFMPDPDALMNKHRLASTNRIAYVCVDRDVVYEVQEDADTTPIAAASIGLNCSLTTTAGNTTTGISKVALDSSAVATTATLPVKVLGLSKRVGNALNTGGSGVDAAWFEVVLNTGILMDNIAGA